jgi:hypothetical protein
MHQVISENGKSNVTENVPNPGGVPNHKKRRNAPSYGGVERAEMYRTLVGFGCPNGERNVPNPGGVKRAKMYRTLVGFRTAKRDEMLLAMVG